MPAFTSWKKFRNSLIVILLALQGAAGAQDLTAKEERCLALADDEAAALSARDWSNLERLATRYEKDCNETLGTGFRSDSIANLALARNELRRYAPALSSAASCIAVEYANPACHVQRVQALLGLQRIEEAKSAISVAQKIVAHQLESIDLDLARSLRPIQREAKLATRKRAEAYEYLLTTLEERYFR